MNEEERWERAKKAKKNTLIREDPQSGSSYSNLIDV